MADDEAMVPLEPSSGDTPPTVTVVAQPQPLAVISTPVVYNKDDLAPHSFMALAIIVAIFCGVVSLLTLMCSIPAIFFSCMVCKFKVIRYPSLIQCH